MPRHCFPDHFDKPGAGDKNVNKAVGHVINDVAAQYHKTNNSDIERLIPLSESMGKEIENACGNK